MNSPDTVHAAVTSAHDPFAGPALSAYFPITESQREVWLASQLGDETNLSYNEGLDVILRGELNEDALRSALQLILDRHEALRASFSEDGEWVMVRQHLPLDLEFHDLRQARDIAAGLGELEREQMYRAFDLEHGPLVRFSLVRVGDREHHLLFVAHHLVTDGWSGAVVVTELGAIYSALVEGRPIELRVAPRYGDYSLVERRFLESASGRAHQAYWLKKLEHSPPTLDIPGDRPRPAQRTYAAGRVDYPLPSTLVQALKKAGASRGASLVTVMLAGFATLLHRLTGAEYLIIGLAAAGQSHHGVGSLVGHCVNLLPLRLRPRAEQSFAEFLEQTRAEVLDAQDHQGSTFGALIPQLKLDRDESRPPLVSVTFNIDVRNDDIRHTGLEVAYRTMVRRFENFELYVNVVDSGKDLLLEVCYNTTLFDEATIRRRIGEYESILQHLCAVIDTPLSSMALIAPEEHERIVRTFNATERAVDLERPIHRWIEAQAERTPDAVAVCDETTSLTYRQLNASANRVAGWLREHGVQADTIVATCVHRTADSLVALLGILKAGGAYLPLDPEYPPERLHYMLGDAQPVALITNFGKHGRPDEARCAALSEGARPTLDLRLETTNLQRYHADDSAESVPSSALAYVIYTSGSTGRAKGTRLEHRGPLNQYQHYLRALRIDAQSRFLVFSSLAFDLTQRNLWAPLMAGGCVVLVSAADYDASAISEQLLRERITHVCCTPSAFYPLIDDADDRQFERLSSLRQVGLGGEPIQLDRLAAWRAHPACSADLTNCYGPTEASANVAMFHLPCKADAPGPGLPIGRPIANVQLYVLDAHGSVLPAGVAGELHIGGVQLARDYLGRPELTAERFIQHPLFGRLYRTGDLCRLRADEHLEFIGRSDAQVKVRGHRVELGEIEAALDAHAAVQRSVCGLVQRSPTDTRLVAWYASNAGAIVDSSELRSHLRERVPAYMVPQHYVAVAALPLLTSGKIDRRRLPDPFANESSGRARQTLARTPVEQAVYAIWKEVLGHEQFDVDDRFLDIGGHSLLAVQVAARLRKTFGIANLPLRLVLTQSLAQIARSIDPSEAPTPAPPPATGVGEPSHPERAFKLNRLRKWLGR